MSYDFDPEQLDRYRDYIDSLELRLRIGGAAIHPLELGVMRLSIAHIGTILDQDIAANEQFHGLVSVDPSVKVG